MLVITLPHIRYRDLASATQEPMLTAIGTGKLLVVLPQISASADELLHLDDHAQHGVEDSTARVLVPLDYPFPRSLSVFTHWKKIAVFLSLLQHGMAEMTSGSVATAELAAAGVISSFAGSLVSIPCMLVKSCMLDKY
ncbi:MAG: hypothetical protein CMM01_09100 [Rhodopirellula sp.]|nr:hypothetical protein [Rhodopirellula sp.]